MSVVLFWTNWNDFREFSRNSAVKYVFLYRIIHSASVAFPPVSTFSECYHNFENKIFVWFVIENWSASLIYSALIRAYMCASSRNTHEYLTTEMPKRLFNVILVYAGKVHLLSLKIDLNNQLMQIQLISMQASALSYIKSIVFIRDFFNE